MAKRPMRLVTAASASESASSESVSGDQRQDSKFAIHSIQCVRRSVRSVAVRPGSEVRSDVGKRATGHGQGPRGKPRRLHEQEVFAAGRRPRYATGPS
jgi:hypothetical protein